MKFETEVMREIWEEPEGDNHLEVGPDRDGLGCVEIRRKDSAGKICERISFPVEEATACANAMLACAKEMSAKQ